MDYMKIHNQAFVFQNIIIFRDHLISPFNNFVIHKMKDS